MEIWQVDAFTDTPLAGNPAAVVFGGADLDADTMLGVSREMNLSETAFVTEDLGEDGHYSVRFFTPRCEVPFGGHPTVATAWAALHRANRLRADAPRRVIQRCGIGDVPIDVTWDGDGVLLTMRQASPRVDDVDLSRPEVATLLGCPVDALDAPDPARVSTGMPWLIVGLTSVEVLDALDPDFTALAHVSARLGVSGITTFAGDARAGALEVRTFAPLHGVPEDPVCGSGNGAVAGYLMSRAHRDTRALVYRASQGRHVSRPGLVHVEAERTGSGEVTIRVGGRAVRVMLGTLELGGPGLSPPPP